MDSEQPPAVSFNAGANSGEEQNPAISDFRAICFGFGVTILLGATMVVAGLKAGITPGASTLVVLTAWSAFQAHVKGAGGRRFLNLAQVAGSSGMAVVSGVIFTMPLLQHIHLGRAQDAVAAGWNASTAVEDFGWNIETDGLGPPILKKIPWLQAQQFIDEFYPVFPGVQPLMMIIFCVAGAFIGYGFVGISTERFLSDPTLAAPEAHACNQMVTASAADAAEQPELRKSLVLSTVSSFLLPLSTKFGFTKPYLYLIASTFQTGREFGLVIPFSPIYVGIGGLLTLSTALVTVAGALMRTVGDALVAPLDGDTAVFFPASTMRWVGGGAMTVGVVFSLFKFMSPPTDEGDVGDLSILSIPSEWMRRLWASVGCGAIILAVGIFVVDGSDPAFAIIMIITILLMASLMVALGAILSLQIGSSASPVSGTVFVTTLVICLVCLLYRSFGDVVGEARLDDVPLMSYMLMAACVAVSTANDAAQDYKTLQLGMIPPRDGFVAQIVGLLGGAVVVPFSYWLTHNAYGMGTVDLPAVQGELFATIIDGIYIKGVVPVWPVAIGLLIGVFAVLAEIQAWRSSKLQLPAMAFAVGLYLPAELGVGIFLGAMARYYGEKAHTEDTGKVERTYEAVLAAAGMITGDALLSLLLGIAVMAGWLSDPDKDMVFFNTEGIFGFLEVDTVAIIFTLLGLQFVCWILYTNSRFGVPEASGGESADKRLNTASSMTSLSKRDKGVGEAPLVSNDVEGRSVEMAS